MLAQMKKGMRRVKKEDSTRVVLTETCPYEVPIIFSNLGFYWHLKKHEAGKSLFPEVMEYLFCRDLSSEYTVPLSYKVRKDEDSFRTLSLLHPRAQYGFVEFYKKFSDQIILSCSKSRFSIRRPGKVAGKYYIKDGNENIVKYRADTISISSSESRHKFLPSFFSYSGYTRLYRFFDSHDFLRLERQYASFWTLDISKFFDSIYTHSITWALKTKEFSKFNSSVKNTFGSVFDRLMQASNYNETAGIVIGPEVCRIFAEVIFQQIDRDIEEELENKGIVLGRDYVIRRYVDDIFVFATTDELAYSICKVVERHAKKYKFNINKAKTVKATRPFVTKKTKSLRLVKSALSRFLEKIVSNGGDGSEKYTPRRVFNRKNVVVAFLNDVKSACIDDVSSYSMVCGYLVSVLNNLLVKVTEKGIGLEFEDESGLKGYSDFYHIILDVLFHLYTVSPGHKASVKVFISSTLACSFFEVHMRGELNSIKSKVYVSCRDFFESSEYIKMASDNNDYALLEALNLLVLLKEMGDEYLVPRQVLQSVVNVSSGRSMSYFEIIVLLYYVGNNSSYAAVKSAVIKNVKLILSDLSDIRINSEKAYLFLDVMTCPYIESGVKNNIASKLFKQMNGAEPSMHQKEELASCLGKYPWFVSWKDADFLTALEKKELLKGY
ncbi:TPA: antiviral reverse transcriptase Drt3b [Pseudomonas aeruginosa]|uniref:antiviral reverse transcriptase Drt3b n=1 Tax=Pseudomonas aeruginosa TaxID=287 RepID=UPI001298743E|nr:antiviral reverse transcriptase Drt3b [Pseudomonas aeruginosa]HBO1242218.1 RNA-directed DNA polymerase [Pseudomonas aeruginosa]HBO1881289.1 RNA-directed DNA polymerase [Pseudomonas aeruginosa]HBO2084637.1 RNA-directed DNA polymerase [Pseudomonas aeruginosa]